MDYTFIKGKPSVEIDRGFKRWLLKVCQIYKYNKELALKNAELMQSVRQKSYGVSNEIIKKRIDYVYRNLVSHITSTQFKDIYLRQLKKIYKILNKKYVPSEFKDKSVDELYKENTKLFNSLNEEQQRRFYISFMIKKIFKILHIKNTKQNKLAIQSKVKDYLKTHFNLPENVFEFADKIIKKYKKPKEMSLIEALKGKDHSIDDIITIANFEVGNEDILDYDKKEEDLSNFKILSYNAKNLIQQFLSSSSINKPGIKTELFEIVKEMYPIYNKLKLNIKPNKKAEVEGRQNLNASKMMNSYTRNDNIFFGPRIQNVGPITTSTQTARIFQPDVLLPKGFTDGIKTAINEGFTSLQNNLQPQQAQPAQEVPDFSNLTNTIAGLNTKIQDLTTQITNLNNSNTTQAKEKIKKLKEEFAKTKAELSQKLKEYDTLQQNYNETKNQLTDLNTQFTDQSNEFANYKTSMEERLKTISANDKQLLEENTNSMIKKFEDFKKEMEEGNWKILFEKLDAIKTAIEGKASNQTTTTTTETTDTTDQTTTEQNTIPQNLIADTVNTTLEKAFSEDSPFLKGLEKILNPNDKVIEQQQDLKIEVPPMELPENMKTYMDNVNNVVIPFINAQMKKNAEMTNNYNDLVGQLKDLFGKYKTLENENATTQEKLNTTTEIKKDIGALQTSISSFIENQNKNTNTLKNELSGIIQTETNNLKKEIKDENSKFKTEIKDENSKFKNEIKDEQTKKQAEIDKIYQSDLKRIAQDDVAVKEHLANFNKALSSLEAKTQSYKDGLATHNANVNQNLSNVSIELAKVQNVVSQLSQAVEKSNENITKSFSNMTANPYALMTPTEKYDILNNRADTVGNFGNGDKEDESMSFIEQSPIKMQKTSRTEGQIEGLPNDQGLASYFSTGDIPSASKQDVIELNNDNGRNLPNAIEPSTVSNINQIPIQSQATTLLPGSYNYHNAPTTLAQNIGSNNSLQYADQQIDPTLLSKTEDEQKSQMERTFSSNEPKQSISQKAKTDVYDEDARLNKMEQGVKTNFSTGDINPNSENPQPDIPLDDMTEEEIYKTIDKFRNVILKLITEMDDTYNLRITDAKERKALFKGITMTDSYGNKTTKHIFKPGIFLYDNNEGNVKKELTKERRYQFFYTYPGAYEEVFNMLKFSDEDTEKPNKIINDFSLAMVARDNSKNNEITEAENTAEKTMQELSKSPIKSPSKFSKLRQNTEPVRPNEIKDFNRQNASINANQIPPSELKTKPTEPVRPNEIKDFNRQNANVNANQIPPSELKTKPTEPVRPNEVRDLNRQNAELNEQQLVDDTIKGIKSALSTNSITKDNFIYNYLYLNIPSNQKKGTVFFLKSDNYANFRKRYANFLPPTHRAYVQSKWKPLLDTLLRQTFQPEENTQVESERKPTRGWNAQILEGNSEKKEQQDMYGGNNDEKLTTKKKKKSSRNTRKTKDEHKGCAVMSLEALTELKNSIK